MREPRPEMPNTYLNIGGPFVRARWNGMKAQGSKFRIQRPFERDHRAAAAPSSAFVMGKLQGFSPRRPFRLERGALAWQAIPHPSRAPAPPPPPCTTRSRAQIWHWDNLCLCCREWRPWMRRPRGSRRDLGRAQNIGSI